jgi:hypothetical protein
MACGSIFGRARFFFPRPDGLDIRNRTVFIAPQVRRPGHGANYSPPCSVDVKKERSFTSSPPIHLRGVHSDKVTCTVFFFNRGSSNVITGFEEKGVNPCNKFLGGLGELVLEGIPTQRVRTSWRIQIMPECVSMYTATLGNESKYIFSF